MSRRDFLGYTTGLIVYFTLPQVARPASGAQVDEERGVNAFLHIAPDSRVTFFCGKVEMGEGNRTALAQMAAEELSLPISSVQMVMGDTDRVPYDGGTWGSTSVRFAGVELRAAAARAREMLAEMAAEKWGVERAAVIVKDGRIALKSGPGASVGLGELTLGKRIVRKLDREPELKPHREYRVVGKPVPQMESRAVVTGTEAFVCDVRLPGMLYGAVLYQPSFGATLTGIDASRAESLPGVAAVVREGDFVGVVAVNSDVASEAVGLIRATWKEQAHPSMAGLYDDLKRTADEGYDVEEEGDVAAALENAHHTLTARYCTPFVAHAPIEPHSALAGGSRSTPTPRLPSSNKRRSRRVSS
jgi:isoquinoline 1-oxidoreductase